MLSGGLRNITEANGQTVPRVHQAYRQRKIKQLFFSEQRCISDESRARSWPGDEGDMFGPCRRLFLLLKKLTGMSPDLNQRKLLRPDTSFSQHMRVQIRTEGTPVKLADPQVNQIQKVFIQPQWLR